MVSTLPGQSARELADGRFELADFPEAEFELRRGNPRLIWGWKRDVGNCSRAVYFGGDISAINTSIILARWYLYYRHRSDVAAIDAIAASIRDSANLAPYLRSFRIGPQVDGRRDLRLELGTPDADDLDRIRRLQLRRPRRRFADIIMPPSLPLASLEDCFPADIYIGSGLSYEAGLPTLCDMHLAFGVDNEACTQFAVGAEDLLPARLATDLAGALGSFCAVHVGALPAEPTSAMRAIATLHKAGRIGRIFTDNVDNMLAKLAIPFERTRGSGVFNEVYPAVFQNRRLIVVGVAADRRSLVRQARAKGIEVIVVNPCAKVAPMVRHLDYIRPTDPFFKVTADTFFAHATESALLAGIRAAA